MVCSPLGARDGEVTDRLPDRAVELGEPPVA
jgi:hypothetical protein